MSTKKQSPKTEAPSVIGKVCQVFVEAIHDGTGRIVGTIMDEQDRNIAHTEGKSIQQAALKQFFNL